MDEHRFAEQFIHPLFRVQETFVPCSQIRAVVHISAIFSLLN